MSDKLAGGIRAGSTSVSIDVLLRDTAGAEVTGKVHTDATAYYWRQGGSPTAITTATLAAINSAWSSGGFKEADATNMPGSYRLDVPDAAFASGADWVEINVKVSGAMVHKERFALTTDAAQTGDAYATAVSIKAKTDNLPTDPADASDIAAALATLAGYVDTEVAAIKAKTDQLVFTVAGLLDVNPLALNGSTAAAAALSRAAQATVLGTVGSGSSTTSIVTSSLDPAAAATDQFKGRVLIFDRSTATIALRGQGAPLSGSSAGGVLSIASANALSVAPSAGDTFSIT